MRQAEAQIAATNKRLSYLAERASYPRQDLEILRELTRILPLSAYVQRMDLTRTDVVIVGEFAQALELLKMLDASPLLRDSEFISAPSRVPSGKEIFQTRAKREYPKPGAAPAAAGANNAPAAQPPAPTLGLPPNFPKVAPPPPLPPGVR